MIRKDYSVKVKMGQKLACMSLSLIIRFMNTQKITIFLKFRCNEYTFFDSKDPLPRCGKKIYLIKKFYIFFIIIIFNSK